MLADFHCIWNVQKNHFFSQLDVYGVKNIGRIEIQLSRRHLNLVPVRLQLLISALKDADHQLLIKFQQN